MALTGKNAIVTGAASGFGQVTTELLVDRGVNVVAVDIDAEGLDETERVAGKADSEGNVVTVQADVSDADDVASFVETTIERFGSIDILFNNAGILHSLVGVEELDESEYDQTMAVNVKSVYLATKYAVPYMREQESGVIINTASIAGRRPRDNESAYVASKAAVIMLTKELAVEMAEDGIRVNAINPVASNTSLLDRFSEQEVEELASTVPMGRLAKPEDVANAVAFLADNEKAGLITGIDLNIDGGRGI